MVTRTFHVVCRDCPSEHLADSRSEARRTARRHTGDTGHRTEFGRIS